MTCSFSNLRKSMRVLLENRPRSRSHNGAPAMETSHYPTVAQKMHGLSTTMKKMKMQVHKPQSLLTFGVVVLMATLVRGVQADTTTESGPSGETLKPPIDQVPTQRFDRNFESFAPAVEKVAPAVVRIVTALSSDTPADLANGGQDAL